MVQMHPSIGLIWYAFVFGQNYNNDNRWIERSKCSFIHSTSADDDTLDDESIPTTTKVSKRIKTRIPILQYHDEWVCVNKPPGISIHKTKNIPYSQQVLTSILKRQLARKVYPVHRLDHRTSGALLLAFNPQMCASLHRCLRWTEEEDGEDGNDLLLGSQSMDTSSIPLSLSDSACKEYIALVRGDWLWKYDMNQTVTITKPLLINGILKDAHTDFQCLASFSNPDIQPLLRNSTSDTTTNDKPKYPFNPTACSLLLCTPKTGRTHQIRRHAYSIGMPILGDYEHGDSKVNRWWKQERGLNRLFLHCFSLNLPPLDHRILKQETIAITTIIMEGETRTRLECIAPLTTDLLQILQREDMKDVWNNAIRKDSRLLKEFVDEKGGTYGRNYKSRESGIFIE